MLNMQTYLGWKIDFANPPGAAAFTGPDSVSWRVFKNPIALSVGGVAAVLLEFADARIRSGDDRLLDIWPEVANADAPS